VYENATNQNSQQDDEIGALNETLAGNVLPSNIDSSAILSVQKEDLK
jgi:hypothetical protein